MNRSSHRKQGEHARIEAGGERRGRRCFLRQAGRWVFLSALMAGLGACSRAPDPEAPAAETAPGEAVTGRLEIQALYAAEGPQADGVRLSVYNTASGERAAGPRRATSFEMAPGRYRVDAVLGAAEASVEADVRAEELTRETIVFDAGVLHLAVLLKEGGEEAHRPTITVFAAERDLRRDLVAVAGPTRGATFTLPEGDLLVRVKSGAVTVDEPVAVRAGERTEAVIVLDAGILQAGARQEDGTAARATWEVLSGQEDIRGERDSLAGPSRGETWSMLLPAGEHLLRARYGDDSREETIVIEPGARTEIDVVF